MPNWGASQFVELADGEQFNTYVAADERFPIGTLGILQDGRMFRFAKNGGSTLVRGDVICGQAPLSGHVDRTGIATALGAVTTSVVIATTAVTADQYKDGYVSVSVAPGAGQIYRIASHAAVTSTGTFAIPFAPGNQIRGAAITTTSRLDLIPNPYKAVIQSPATTQTSAPVGVAVSAPLLNQHCWIQVAGVASVLTAGTLIIGNRAVVPTGTAGACGPETAVATTSDNEVTIGIVLRVAASTAWSAIDLKLMG